MFAITNTRIYTITHGVIPAGTVVVDGGRIVSVAPGGAPAGVPVLDAGGRYLFPGFIDAYTLLGVHEDANTDMGFDADEYPMISGPGLRVLDAVYPGDIAFRDAVAAGVTTVMASPGYVNVVGGLTAVIKTAGATVDDMLVKDKAALRVAVSGTPRFMFYFGPPPVDPRDRAQEAAIFEADLQRGREYLAKKASRPEDTEPDLHLEAIAAVLEGRIPVLARAPLNHDVSNILWLARKWGFRVLLEGLFEGHLVADEIAQSGAPAIVGPMLADRRAYSRYTSARTPLLLQRAGVKVALTTGHPTLAIQFLPVEAAYQVQQGMPEEDALRAITINPAEILGLGDRLGSIDAGKDADLVLWSGHPFDTASRVDVVYINGKEVYRRDGVDIGVTESGGAM